MAHYKYKLLHVLTGNYIHVCYDDRITNNTISRRIKAWNKLPRNLREKKLKRILKNV